MCSNLKMLKDQKASLRLSSEQSSEESKNLLYKIFP